MIFQVLLLRALSTKYPEGLGKKKIHKMRAEITPMLRKVFPPSAVSSRKSAETFKVLASRVLLQV